MEAVLAREDSVVGKVFVRWLLDELDIAENRRVRGLGPRQKERLLVLRALKWAPPSLAPVPRQPTVSCPTEHHTEKTL